jgi:hypothetical protein
MEGDGALYFHIARPNLFHYIGYVVSTDNVNGRVASLPHFSPVDICGRRFKKMKTEEEMSTYMTMGPRKITCFP